MLSEIICANKPHTD